MYNLLLNAANNAAGENAGGSILSLIIPFVILFGLMYLLIFLPQKRRDKKAKKMLEEMVTGDNIVTIGGIKGKVINIKDDEVVIESGIDKTKLTMRKTAISEVVKPLEA